MKTLLNYAILAVLFFSALALLWVYAITQEVFMLTLLPAAFYCFYLELDKQIKEEDAQNGR